MRLRNWVISIEKYIPRIWKHYCIVRDKGKVSIFINGELDKNKKDMSIDFWIGEPQ